MTIAKQVKQFMKEMNITQVVDVYHACHVQGIKVSQCIDDQQQLMQTIIDELNQQIEMHGFSVSTKEDKPTSKKLHLHYESMGVVGGISLKKKEFKIKANPFNVTPLFEYEEEYVKLKTSMPTDPLRLKRYQHETMILPTYNKLKRELEESMAQEWSGFLT